ncbi:hypothetical protein A2U01_0093429, partial [Trifolium medium]|nr:hypothetical protein [Trifolium medium]
MVLSKFEKVSANCEPRRQGQRIAPASAEEVWNFFCHLRIAQEGWRVAPGSYDHCIRRFVKWRIAQLHV